MAIAGIENASVIDSSFPHESRPRAFRQREDNGRASFRASSLLQMWRDLEDDHVMSHARDRDSERSPRQRRDPLTTDISRENMSDNTGSEHSCVLDGVNMDGIELGGWSPAHSDVGSHSSRENLSSFSSEDSTDFAVVERARVRQIWMNSGTCEGISISSHTNNLARGECLEGSEQGRVRIIREWVHTNSQQRGVSAEASQEQSAEVTTQIEQVLDGRVVNETRHIRRGIRKLCGRQVLLDILKKAERERQRELEGLMEHHAVSNFAHRIRIQSLLRGRFLRNGGMADSERPTSSSAATELGFLRERHTVSGLREEFISRLDPSVSGGTSQSDIPSGADSNCNRNERNYTSSLDNGNHSNSVDEHDHVETDNPEFSGGTSDLGYDITQNPILQQRAALVEEQQENAVRELRESDGDEFPESREDTQTGLDSHQREDGAWELSSENLEYDASQHFNLQGASEGSYEQTHTTAVEEGSDQIVNPNFTLNEQLNDGALQNEESDWQVISAELEEERDDINDEVDMNVPDNNHFTSEFLVDEFPEVQSSDGDLQESEPNWPVGISEPSVVSFGRTDTFYLPEDGNASNSELRELLSRRRVSNLLQSGFRESLDQLIQSYAERQNHAPVEWEQNEAYPDPALADQEIEHEDVDDLSEDQDDDAGESPPLSLPSPMIPMPPHWDHEQRNSNWPTRDMHQTIDWEAIGDLRTDMARLQQRMNNLQRMLETCMDMQVEIQRSIREELSSAMIRASSGPSGTSRENLESYESRWEYVRKGVCCICCDSNIDSLLYRCGHMCACSKCANELVQRGEKCPMCRAPVIEAVRAYSIL